MDTIVHNIKYTHANIKAACVEVGEEITEYLNNIAKTKVLGGDNSPPSYLYICLLSGAVPYFSELTPQLPSGQCVYIRASSYGTGRTSGELKLDVSTLPDPTTLFDAVVIVDDICDTGKTLEGVIHVIENYFEYDVFIFTTVLINKAQPNRHAPQLVDFAGFDDNSDDFYAGFGLDNQNLDRNINYIYICN